jgi:hypothetical protein
MHQIHLLLLTRSLFCRDLHSYLRVSSMYLNFSAAGMNTQIQVQIQIQTRIHEARIGLGLVPTTKDLLPLGPVTGMTAPLACQNWLYSGRPTSP